SRSRARNWCCQATRGEDCSKFNGASSTRSSRRAWSSSSASLVPGAANSREEVSMSFKQTLMACSALVGAWLLMPASASAQSASEAEKIRNLERQTELLQMQLKELKGEIARMRKVEAAPAAPVAVAAAGPVDVAVAGAAAPLPGGYVKGAP